MANKSGAGSMDKGHQGAGASVEGTAAPAGCGQTPTPAGGAGAGEPVARDAPPWGSVVTEKAHCPPHYHPGLGDTTVQACRLAGPTRVRPLSTTTNIPQLEDQQDYLDRTIPPMPGARWQGLAQGQLGNWGSSKALLLCLCPACLTSVPPSHILSSQHSDVPKTIGGTLRSQPGYSQRATISSISGHSVLNAVVGSNEGAPNPRRMGSCSQQSTLTRGGIPKHQTRASLRDPGCALLPLSHLLSR